MQKKSIDMLAYNNLRVAIIEPTPEGRFGLIVAIDTESFVVTNTDNTLYVRDTLEAITTDLAHCTIDELFLHVNAYRLNAPSNPDVIPYIPVEAGNVSGYIPLKHTPIMH